MLSSFAPNCKLWPYTQAEYRTQVSRPREVQVRLPAAQPMMTAISWPEAAHGGAAQMVLGGGGGGGGGGEGGGGDVTDEVLEQRRDAVYTDLLQGGACKRVAEAVAPAAGASLVVLAAAAAAAGALARIADYANDRVLLDALAPLERVLDEVRNSCI
jgi:hypothetical protein